MNLHEVMNKLKKLGNESTKKVFIRHGAKEPFYGVKIEELKKIQKKIKVDQNLAMDLYETGNSDAMYLAGLIVDPSKMTKTDLNNWAKKAYWYLISEYTISSVAARSKHGKSIALKWIDSPKENIASAGWATLSTILVLQSEINITANEVEGLLDRVSRTIHTSLNRVRYTMNGFVIAVGSYVPSMTKKAIKTANQIGKVNVNMGQTACKVPPAAEYVAKVINRQKKKKAT